MSQNTNNPKRDMLPGGPANITDVELHAKFYEGQDRHAVWQRIAEARNAMYAERRRQQQQQKGGNH